MARRARRDPRIKRLWNTCTLIPNLSSEWWGITTCTISLYLITSQTFWITNQLSAIILDCRTVLNVTWLTIAGVSWTVVHSGCSAGWTLYCWWALTIITCNSTRLAGRIVRIHVLLKATLRMDWWKENWGYDYKNEREGKFYSHLISIFIMENL